MNEKIKATLWAGIGGIIGAGASEIIGGIGLAVGGTAIGIGIAPLAAAGSIIGLAGYGISRVFGGK